jgi:hypothetical protein
MMRGYIEDMKAIIGKMEEKWAALEADVGMAPKTDDTAPADPVVAPPVDAPVEAPADADAPAADDGSAADEPDPVADPAPDPITSPDDSGDAVQV